jgi:uncharacterized protein YfiM (DUF2279 family)
MPIRGHLRMRVSSALTGAAVELISQSAHGSSDVVMVRLLEPAAGYAAGVTLYVAADEFVAD